MSPIEHVWDALDRRCVLVLCNIHQLLTAIEEEWDNIPQVTINSRINSMRRSVSRCMMQMVVTSDWYSNPRTYVFLRNQWPTYTYLYSQSCEIHILGPNEYISIDWFPYMNCNSIKSLAFLCVVFLFFFSVNTLYMLYIGLLDLISHSCL